MMLRSSGGWPRAVAALALFSLLSSGCWMSHRLGAERDGGAARADAAIHDAAMVRPRDGGPPRPDGGPITCDRLAIGPSVSLVDPGGVTPRVVALEGTDVAVVYVDYDGDPTSVYYERLDARLARITGPARVASDSYTWAEPARFGDGLAVAFGRRAAEPTVLVPIDLDGVVSGPRMSVRVAHPIVLRRTGSGLFWLAFEMHEENAFAIAHLDEAGALLHDVQRIALGRYGSAHGAAMRPGGRSGHVLAYASEGPPGVRDARVNAISETGVLAGERTLATDGADAVMPVFVGEELRIVRRSDDAITVSTLDPETLETIEERAIERLGGAIFTAVIEDRFVVGAVEPPRVVVLDLEEDPPARLDAMVPTTGWSGAISWASVPGALVVAASLVAGAESFPWLVRIECAPGS
jgi:hypothetical protein